MLTVVIATKMSRQESLKCRLCLGRGGRLTNIFSENDDAEQLVREAIEELLELKVVRDNSNPWFICYQCFKILTDFYMFKQQCYENNLTLERQTEYKQEEGNISPEKVRVKREEMDVGEPVDIEIPASQDEVNHNIQIQEETSVEVIVKREKMDVGEPVGIDIPASQDEVNHNIQIQEESSLKDNLEDAEINLPSEEEVNIKEDCDADIPQMKARLEGEMLQEQDKHQKQDDAGKGASASQLHVCKICCKVFEQRELLTYHVMHVHLNKVMQFRCDVCLEAFKRRNDLASHIKLVHALKKKHQCEFCSKNFLNFSKLKIHMSTHTGERPHKCNICSKAFTQRIHLKSHMSIHTGKTPHKCTFCSKAFATRTHLKRHMWTHTGEKPHKCNVCSKAFIQHFHLRSHMTSHTGEKPYKCYFCSKAFARNADLKAHIMTHTGEKPHTCKICLKAFIQSNQLKRHMKTHQ